MQFTTIITVLAAALAINGAPLEQRNPNCPANQNAKCCNALLPTIIGGALVQIGVGCVDLIAGNCNAETACCSSQNNGGANVQVCNLL
ncbi:hypothetical protein H2201_005373 [Coniosporium apollinis]|uniref:Hydrophobin n=1 Tax=Coniosporium apollinis TaxID=61459 RepID=A0ABQ9NPW2_9PEZI|nr:hypothetical protein H2201_005373 [Coniosporium apollinis]